MKKNKVSLISPEIKEILSSPNKEEKIREVFSEFHPRDIFILCENLEPQENAEIIIALGRPLGIDFFEEFEVEEQEEIFKYFPKKWMGRVLDEMASDERADFIKALPKERADEVLPLVAQAERNDIKKLIQYDEGTAGSILTTEYAFISKDITVKEAIDKLKLQAFDRETIYYVYVVDQDRQLLGFISLKDLLISPAGKLIKDVMHTNVISSLVDEDKELVAKKLSDYDLLAIPIVDKNNKLIGIVTVDDVVDVIVDESTEDIYRYGAAGEHIDYMKAHAGTIAKHRILWLLVLVVMGFFAGMIMEGYAYQLEAVVALAFFIPLLCDSGGNAGTQSSTVVIRGLATGEVKMKDIFLVFRKELVTSIIVGLAMGVLAAARAIIQNRDPLLAITVGLAMIVTVMLGTTLGAMLPLLFKKLKLDPALMSGPFITSFVDIASLLVYFWIAVRVFN